ncbi:MAG TPA: MFS transporter [Candidatus Limnocylindrales bacterium]|nr:MFS transporter [Candidatus Limnocylindrales bacterium]
MPKEVELATSNRARWLVLSAAFLGWMFDGVEQGVFPLVARPALQDLLGVETDALVGPWIGYITALFLLGAACGGLCFGWLGDRVGRVRAMMLSILAYSLFTGACYFIQAPWELGLFRFLAAVGMGGEWSLGVALVMECWPENRRPLLAAAIGAAANIGFGLLGVAGMMFHVTRDSWRWVMLAGAAPALLALFIARYVPESEKWRFARETTPAKPLQEIFSRKLARKTILGLLFASIALIGTWGSVQWLPSWADQLTHGTVQNAKGTTQLLIASGAVLGCLIGPWIGGTMGRRPAYSILCLCSLLACACLFRTVHQYGLVFLLMVFVVGTTTGSFYGWLPLYLPELFPTRVRATGQGVAYNSGRILAALGAIEMGQLLRFYQGSYARAGATITLIYSLGLVLIWFAPETKGQRLPD